MERLTEEVYGKYIRIKGTKSLYERYERDGAPLSNAIVRLSAYEDTGLEPEDMKRAFNEDAVLKLAGQALGMSPDRLRELAQAEKEGRLVVLPRLHGKKLLRDGLEFEPNHWNITLTAFAHNQPTKSGKRVGLFSICEAAEAAMEEREADHDR